MEEYMLPCLNKKLFGFECMGCGLQRSFSLILHGEFLEAFYMYPAIYTLILFFGFIIIGVFKSFKNSSRILSILAIVNALIIVISFVLKTFVIK